MSQSIVTLRAYLETLLSERDVTSFYARLLRYRVDAFGHYLGRMATLADLTPEAVNTWVKHLQETSGFQPKTIRHYQAAVVSVWREAYDRRDWDLPPLRIRRIKVPKKVVRAWTRDELRALLAATKHLRRKIPGTKISKRDWMRAYIYAAYCTGFRRCDLMHHALRKDLRDDVLTIVERKTGKVISRRLSAQSLAALELVRHDTYLLPWYGDVRRFYQSFRVLVVKSAVTAGGPHKIRKSAGSYAQRNGGGQALLGHEDAATFHRHYHDRSISRQVPEPPPEL